MRRRAARVAPRSPGHGTAGRPTHAKPSHWHRDGAAPLAHRSPGVRVSAMWLKGLITPSPYTHPMSAAMFFPLPPAPPQPIYTHPPQADEYIQRALVEEDVGGREGSAEGDSGRVGEAAGEEGRRLYSRGDFAAAKAKSLDAYLTTKRCWQVGKFPDVLERLAVRHLELLHCKPHPPSPPPRLHWCWQVGMFPDVLERLALRHLEQGDQVSALVAGEFYARKHFPGFAHPFTFNAQLLLSSLRFCLPPSLLPSFPPSLRPSSPYSPLSLFSNAQSGEANRGEGCGADRSQVALVDPGGVVPGRRSRRAWQHSVVWAAWKQKEVAELAGYGDSQLEYALERLTEEGRKEDVNKGKAEAQVALDQAAFLLDVAAAEGTWDETREQLAGLYREAGLEEMASFVLAGPPTST
ncbi:unnamed protein product [Closterium sp. NIES-65]|nr:unnamed protein product [Closterium sp. NIES-65]